MAGLFSLGPQSNHNHNKEEEREHHHHHNNNTTFQLLLRNEIYNNHNNSNRGFEIWPQTSSSTTTTTNYFSFGLDPNHHNNNNHLNDDVSVSFSDDSTTRFGFTVMRASSSGSGLGSGMSCQDCGNQAKKDCVHQRCRTCCRSRGFQCSTHVKSTWVPAAKRRERQHQHHHHQQQAGTADALNSSARPLREGGDAALPSVPVPITTTGLEVGQFPPELNSAAMFRCVKVSPMDAQDERYAYQTAVNIGGHVFKGILYDQGPDGPYNPTTGEGSSQHQHHNQQLSLITTTTTTTTTAGASNNPFDSNSHLYPGAPMMNAAFMGAAAGTQFFPPPRS